METKLMKERAAERKQPTEHRRVLADGTEYLISAAGPWVRLTPKLHGGVSFNRSAQRRIAKGKF